jgi:hypothetical protein
VAISNLEKMGLPRSLRSLAMTRALVLLLTLREVLSNQSPETNHRDISQLLYKEKGNGRRKGAPGKERQKRG